MKQIVFTGQRARKMIRSSFSEDQQKEVREQIREARKLNSYSINVLPLRLDKNKIYFEFFAYNCFADFESRYAFVRCIFPNTPEGMLQCMKASARVFGLNPEECSQ